jgi:hypothetical protein
MRRKHIALLVAAMMTCALSSQAREKKLDRSELPRAVENTVRQQSQGATIKGFSVERENGKDFYEAEMIVNGRGKDILIAADGTLTEIEEEIAFENLPLDVQSALKAKAKGADITRVESITKQSRLVAYEAATLKGGRKSEIQVGPDGKSLAQPE